MLSTEQTTSDLWLNNSLNDSKNVYKYSSPPLYFKLSFKLVSCCAMLNCNPYFWHNVICYVHLFSFYCISHNQYNHIQVANVKCNSIDNASLLTAFIYPFIKTIESMISLAFKFYISTYNLFAKYLIFQHLCSFLSTDINMKYFRIANSRACIIMNGYIHVVYLIHFCNNICLCSWCLINL